MRWRDGCWRGDRVTGEIINLRRVKKARDKARLAGEAAAKRALHGQTRAERAAVRAREERERRVLEGAKLGGDGEAGE